jgi:hypothetical protein
MCLEMKVAISVKFVWSDMFYIKKSVALRWRLCREIDITSLFSSQKIAFLHSSSEYAHERNYNKFLLLNMVE